MLYAEPNYSNIPDEDVTKGQLVSLLKQKRAILMAGAGSSCIAGFPQWGELIDALNSRLDTPLQMPTNIDLTAFADMIKEQFGEEKRVEDYYNFLERAFEPKQDRKNCEDFHVTLVQLGFSGLVTTNYDVALEEAVRAAYTDENGTFRCESIDLCDDRPYRILDFLRELPLAREPRWVLHIHGYYRNPKGIILTQRDYLEKYGELAFDESGNTLRRVLDTLHRKVIWSLLSGYTLVFVGFSMQDEFFMQMLKLVQVDFMSGSDPLHFAILPYTLQADKEETSRILRKRGVRPVFYYVPESEDPDNRSDHSGLIDLIYELARLVGTPVGPANLIALTKRMLER